MRFLSRLKKLEVKYPAPVAVVHREGACFLERFEDHVGRGMAALSGVDQHLDDENEGDYCDQYDMDCRSCQEGRGVPYKRDFIIK